jgi:hypothetical protein
MKRLLIISMVTLLPCFLFAQVPKSKTRKEIRVEKRAKLEKRVKSTIESGNYTFVVRTANPFNGPTVTLTSDYEIIISGDSAYSYLPYFGEAYRMDYGNADGGIKFKGIRYNAQKEFNEQSKYYEIQFEIIKPDDTYKIYMSISASGYGNLKIISESRQTISYDGILGNLLE